MENDDILGPPITDADPDLGYTLEEMRAAVKEGLESGTSKFETMAEIMAECHRRFDAEQISRPCVVKSLRFVRPGPALQLSRR